MKVPGLAVTSVLLVSEGFSGARAAFHLRGAEGVGSTATTLDSSFSGVNVQSPAAAHNNMRRMDAENLDHSVFIAPDIVEPGNGQVHVGVGIVSGDSPSSGAATAEPVTLNLPDVSDKLSLPAPPRRREVPSVTPATISTVNASSGLVASPPASPKEKVFGNSGFDMAHSPQIEYASLDALTSSGKIEEFDAHHFNMPKAGGSDVADSNYNHAREPYQPNIWASPEDSSSSAYRYRSQPYHPQNPHFLGGMNPQIGWRHFMGLPLKVSRGPRRIEL